MSGFNDEKKLTQPSPDDAGLSDKMKQLNVLEKLQQSIAHKTGVADGAPADVNSMQSIDELKAFIRQQQYKAEIEKVKKKMAKKEKQVCVYLVFRWPLLYTISMSFNVRYYIQKLGCNSILYINIMTITHYHHTHVYPYISP